VFVSGGLNDQRFLKAMYAVFFIPLVRHSCRFPPAASPPLRFLPELVREHSLVLSYQPVSAA
jgi:hypothetical protein